MASTIPGPGERPLVNQLLFRHLGLLPVDDYDTDDYYNQDIHPLSTLCHKYAHKYAERLGRLIALQGNRRNLVTTDPESRKRSRLPSSSPPPSPSRGEDFSGGAEKGESSSSGSMFKFKKARRSYRQPTRSKRLHLEEESCSDSKNEDRCSGGKCKKKLELPDLNATIQSEVIEISSSKTREQEIENNLSSAAAGNSSSEERKRNPKPKIKKTAKKKSDSSTSLTIAFPVWELQPKPTPNAVIPPEFQVLIDEMGGGGTEVKFLVRKKLYGTDLSNGQNRLPIYFGQICNQFLTLEEFNAFEEKALTHGVSHRIDVKVIDTKGKVWSNFGLVRWPKAYSLNTDWYQLCVDNELEVDDWLNVWSFRENGQLVFVLVKEKE